MKRCFLFPGQGAQYPGMGRQLWEQSQGVKQLFELASDYCRMNMQKLLFESTEEELKQTDKTQIAITLMNLAASTMLEERDIIPHGFAGFSLGEYSALCKAGIIKIEDVFPIVKARGEFMARASSALDTKGGSPGMAAVIGLSYEQICNIIEQLKDTDIYIANYNSPVQIVLSGTANGLNKAEEACKNQGAKRYIRLKVSGPFHSPLLNKAKEDLQALLADYQFSDPTKPLFANVTGKQIESGQQAKELCAKQVVSTVKWVDEEKALLEQGFDTFYETGPGSVLKGLLRAYDKKLVCYSAGKLEDIEKID